ncbi:uncharacterized protein LOC122255667 [Penaeus japonicus]|uniref:uncharacterized protein LOC122255667 n=1 Tax=Penaeus japonicus TaxID=27405 RepID=UPI001C70B31A|nr:uncharacterized protein LOC122255667 [Penaeus japonicus]
MVKSFVFVLLMAVAIHGRKCWNRHEDRHIREIVRNVSCMDKPRKTLVPLPVPKGFDWVYPSVLEVHKCGGQMCIQLDQECVATATINRTCSLLELFGFRSYVPVWALVPSPSLCLHPLAPLTSYLSPQVNAYKMNDLMEFECRTVTVPEDVNCGCRCDKSQETCGVYEVFNRNFCRCECKKGLQNECKEKMAKMPGLFMWDGNSCTCPCNNQHVKCGDGQVFVQSTCECRYVMDS